MEHALNCDRYPSAVVETPWGVSQCLDLFIHTSTPADTHQIRVADGTAKALAAAVDEASQYVGTHAQATVDITLGTYTYTLVAPVLLPNRTRLVGAGAGKTTLDFHLAPPPPPPTPPAPPAACSKHILADFYTKDCAARGCHTRECPGCFLEIGVTHSAGSADGCCTACGKNPRCNAFTFVGSVDLPGGYCSLSYCPDQPTDGHPSSCASTPSAAGPANRTSGWVLGRSGPVPSTPQAAIIAAGHGSSLSAFSLRVSTAYALMPAVWVQVRHCPHSVPHLS